jgi:hypothetical protein
MVLVGMRQVLLVTVLLVLAFGDQAFAQLKLETEIVNQYYCPGDDDLDGLSLNLKLKFTNIGSESLILAKDSAEIGQMIVSKDENGRIGDREMNSTVTWVSSGEWKATPADLNGLFVALAPNETYETKTATRVFVLRVNRSGIAGAVGNGSHLLQIRVSTWLGSRENADELQEIWNERGRLWTTSVVSDPMPFAVVAKRKLTKCR